MCKIRQLKPNYINIRISGIKATGEKNNNPGHQIQDHSRNTFPVPQETTPQQTAIHRAIEMCTASQRHVAVYSKK
jgi:hypothetical protein